jgi:uncharacterized protein YjbJ (UPF0337 family)
MSHDGLARAPIGVRSGRPEWGPTTRRKELIVGSSLDDAKGKAKEAVGDVTDDDKLKGEGKLDQAGADFKEFGDKVKDKIHGAVDSVKGRLEH